MTETRNPAEGRTTPALDTAMLIDLGTELLAELRNVVAALKDSGLRVAVDTSYLAAVDHAAGKDVFEAYLDAKPVELEQWWDCGKVPDNVPYRGKGDRDPGYWINHGGTRYFREGDGEPLCVSRSATEVLNERAPFVRVEVK